MHFSPPVSHEQQQYEGGDDVNLVPTRVCVGATADSESFSRSMDAPMEASDSLLTCARPLV